MQYLRLCAVLYCSALIFGMNVGIQGIVSTISTRGVFSDDCAGGNRSDVNASAANHSLPCRLQEKHIALAINVMLSVTNLVSLPNGFLIDAIGGERVTIAAVASWVLAAMASGIYPASGIVWSVALSVIGWANSAAFMAFTTYHLREACNHDKGQYAFWSTVSMSFRAIGALTSVPMSYFLAIGAVDLWLLYVLWGAGVGLPVLTVFVVLYLRGKAAEASSEQTSLLEKGSVGGNVSLQATDKRVSEAPKNAATLQSSATMKMQKSFQDFKLVVYTLPFWTLTFRLTVVVTFGSIFIANLNALARYHDATQSEMTALRQHFTFILGGLGVTNPIPGYIIKRTGTHVGIAAVSGISIAYVALWVCGSIYDKGEFSWLFYFALASFALWRYWCYGVCALYVPTVFPDRQAGYGLIFGASGGVAGAVSVAIGSVVTNAVQDNPASVPFVIGVFGVLAAVADAFTIGSMTILWKRAKFVASAAAPVAKPLVVSTPPPSLTSPTSPASPKNSAIDSWRSGS